MGRKSILYAEDEYTNRKVMEIQCQRHGIECVVEEDGEKALARCQRQHFDLVILDQYMPSLNGDLVAKEIRKLYPTITLVAITSDDSCVAQLKESGFDFVYIKPLRMKEYQELLEKFLS